MTYQTIAKAKARETVDALLFGDSVITSQESLEIVTSQTITHLQDNKSIEEALEAISK